MMDFMPVVAEPANPRDPGCSLDLERGTRFDQVDCRALLDTAAGNSPPSLRKLSVQFGFRLNQALAGGQARAGSVWVLISTGGRAGRVHWADWTRGPAPNAVGSRSGTGDFAQHWAPAGN